MAHGARLQEYKEKNKLPSHNLKYGVGEKYENGFKYNKVNGTLKLCAVVEERKGPGKAGIMKGFLEKVILN